MLCVDEKSHVQALARSQPAFPMMSGRPAKRTLDYVRHGTTGLGVPLLGAPSGGVAAFNTADGTVISRLHRRHPGLGNPGPAAARRFTVLTPVRNAGNDRLRRCAGHNTWRDVLISSCISHRPPPPLTHCSPTPVRGAERSRGGGADSAPAKQTAKQIRLRPILRIENTENPGISTHKFDFYNDLPAQDTSAGAPECRSATRRWPHSSGRGRSSRVSRERPR